MEKGQLWPTTESTPRIFEYILPLFNPKLSQIKSIFGPKTDL